MRVLLRLPSLIRMRHQLLMRGLRHVRIPVARRLRKSNDARCPRFASVLWTLTWVERDRR
jgi:hypothetical protein